MRKVALVFAVAVFLPSLVLAWLAVRSLRHQQFLLERQESLLYQTVSDARARAIQGTLDSSLQEFTARVSALLHEHPAEELSKSFDETLRRDWPLAEVGFAVKPTGEVVSPLPTAQGDSRVFLTGNGRFLSNQESAEVYLNAPQVLNAAELNVKSPPQIDAFKETATAELTGSRTVRSPPSVFNNLRLQSRNILPQQQSGYASGSEQRLETQSISRLTASVAEFRQLIGDQQNGTLARFVDNKLSLLFWSRAPSPGQARKSKGPAAPAEPVVFGAQISVSRLTERLRPEIELIDPGLRQNICLALLDDNARPVLVSHPKFMAHWKRPFVATEIGEQLPHWEVAVYLLNPAKLTQSAQNLKILLGSLIALLLLAIVAGSWLIVTDLNRQLRLARQKTDFVSNVSHELKTPLTSIRMFSELLSEERVTDPGSQRRYLAIIAAETARLTRLINNVLDFARMERGERKFKFQRLDATEAFRETTEAYRPHLEAGGFQFRCEFPSNPLPLSGDRDALSQILLNLLSNAEKYSTDRKEIELRLRAASSPTTHLELEVSDRGSGVPRGSEEKIFEKFYRAHDSLSSGIQGSGLGLTLARQIARAHGGDIAHRHREGGGSIFVLTLPLLPPTSG